MLTGNIPCFIGFSVDETQQKTITTYSVLDPQLSRESKRRIHGTFAVPLMLPCRHGFR